MKLTDDEKAMLDGKEGPARQRAMDLLVRYGEALGAERFIDTDNVCVAIGASGPFIRDLADKTGSFDAVFSEFALDSSDVVQIPEVKACTYHLIQGLDPDHWEIEGVDRSVYELHMKSIAFAKRIGVQLMNTCTPYLVGNVPVRGEHCAWMESSAVIYANSVLGARMNCEGRESGAAASLTGKIPYWGYHLDQNRLGTHLVEVEYDVESIMDWNLLGYYVGEMVQERVPVLHGIRRTPTLSRLKHCGAAAASSGGVEMYHIVGITPEARSLDEAFGGKKPQATLKFGKKERQMAYENLNSSARERAVDFVMLGCPHYSIEQVWDVCKMLKGRRVNSNTSLWIFTPRALKEIADQNGYTEIITNAGGILMTDTCPVLAHVMPKGTRVAATDSGKQAHYMPSILGLQTWFGTTQNCIEAAVSGQWKGELK
ncbi:MAG TPA: aconitase X catalytic domain-containing protein [Syntrophorhabdales bacterium]|nr:aconitase X catalytic domain-containing protein [Syntrophorhabdales bacterium]